MVYDADLAYIHDRGFSSNADSQFSGMLALLRESGNTEGLVIDLGCGTGLLCQRFMEAGYRALGVDISPAMIEIARAKVPKAEFAVGSFADAPLPECTAVTAFSFVMSYLPRAGNRAESLIPVFRRIHDALRPRGVFLFDVCGPIAGAKPGSPLKPGQPAGQPVRGLRGVAAGEWAVLMGQTEGDKTRTFRFTTFRKEGERYRRTDEEHVMAVYPPAEILEALATVGFEGRALTTYGGPVSDNAVFMGQKP